MGNVKINDFFVKYNNGDFKSKKKYKKSVNLSHDIEKIKKDINYKYVKEWIYHQYNIEGIGIKAIIKNNNLCVTYSVLRRFMINILNIELRKNYEVTNWLSDFRSKKVLKEHEEKSGWFADDVVRKNKRRGLQGYYFNNSTKEYVWLRSSYEYVFAKWLDSMEYEWDIEYKSYRLSDDSLYKPDFFIFKNNELVKIVEIKGYWNNRTYKFHLLEKTIGIDMMLIDKDEISNYSNNIKESIKEWKLLRNKNKNKKWK